MNNGRIEKIKLLINFGPIKKGGGQNVALNFLQELERYPEIEFELYFIACSDSIIYKKLKSSIWSKRILPVSKNPFKRIIQEITIARKFLKKNNIRNVYSYFGFAFFGPGINQVIGSADSNLYFPNIDFWTNETRVEKFKRFLVDKYRIWGLKNATGVIYENKEMYKRGKLLFGIKRRALILPSIDRPKKIKDIDIYSKKDSFKILLLCGWQRNKNILLIPALANELNKCTYNFEFIISTKPDDSSCSREFFQKVKKYNVGEMINCIGQVDKSQLPNLYNSIDCVLLLSLLESFSNNIIESWFYKRPLIIADEPWSRAICSDGALYVNRSDVSEISKTLIKMIENDSIERNLIRNGMFELQKYPTIKQRFNQEIIFLKESLL